MPEAANDTGAGNGNGGAGNGGATQDGSQGGTGQGSGTQQQQGGDYSLASGFLERVAPEHRAIVEPYVKQWDAGVTRRFGELHSQLSPYTELGEVEDLQAALQLVDLLENNPWQVYGVLHQNLMGQEPPFLNGQQQPQLGQQQQGQPGQQGLPGQPSGEGLQLPPEVQARIDKQEQLLVSLAQHILGQQQSSTQAEEDAQLESFLEGLHTEFGDFDENSVLMAIYQGASPEDAVKQYTDGVNQRVQAQLEKLGKIPPILGSGGGGGVPQGQAGVKDLSRKDTQALVSQVLAKSAQARQ